MNHICYNILLLPGAIIKFSMATQETIAVQRADCNDCTFSVLIPSWNNLPYLQNCISSIQKNSSFKHQIIVHVNEGKDGTLDWIKSQPDIDYTWSSKNIGLCYGLNMGRTLVKTPYIVYINDDMYVCPGWDNAFMDEIKSIGHNSFFLNGTSLEPYPGNSCTIYKDYGTDIQSFNEAALLKEFNDIEKADWRSSSWCPNIISVSTWDAIGGYSVEYSPGFYSDPDFAMKLWHAEVRLFKGISKSRAYHFGSKSTGRIKKYKAYFLFIRKWGMTAGTFTKHYLRMGQEFTGPLTEPILTQKIKIKSWWNRLQATFK